MPDFLFSAGGGVAMRGGVATGGVLSEFEALVMFILGLVELKRSSVVSMMVDRLRKEIGCRAMNLATARRSPRPQHLSARCRRLLVQSRLATPGSLSCVCVMQ
jgi:hypothetical protein